jgi:hypothetical protein
VNSGNTAAASIIGIENSIQIPRAMQHADNLDSVRHRQIKNHIAAKGKVAEVLAELAARAGYVRIAHQAMETLVEPVEKRVGPCLAVLADNIPDFRQTGGSRAAGRLPLQAECRLHPARIAIDIVAQLKLA